ncbi:NUDIX hydrolase [Embleya scabrispora]|uniref:NUDIX hydrolase n=1 Tax=Embleya scabrispora TaxID=159449 RepID=A0A1T3NIU4_9ACTN|nr:NUDIX hydrolase [Embleya scabrispora]OPC76759.1 NUDIX hydrolase [Embleya scabrispora]
MTHLPPAEYYATLPHHIGGAGAILHDTDGRFLLVEPAYGDGHWEIPGGAMDEGEYPWDTARREIKEELGLDLTPGRLLAVDWVPPQPDGRPALANYLFDGGPVTETHAKERIRLAAGELTAWHLAAPTEWDTLMAPHMARRLHACANALADHTTAYLHHGTAPTNNHRDHR